MKLYWKLRESLRNSPLVKLAHWCEILTARPERDIRDAQNGVEGAPSGVALCVRIRNEALNLREFCDYYRAAGIKHIYFVEAGSEDNFREVLGPYIHDGFVTLFSNWQPRPISPSAEHTVMTLCVGMYEWVGCLDADEFVVVKNGLPIPEFLSLYRHQPALALHWWNFGASGHQTRIAKKPLIDALYRRAAKPNRHFKVFVRTDSALRNRNSHNWYYRGCRRAVDELGRPVMGSVASPTAQHAWINHYPHKSIQDMYRKCEQKSILDKCGIENTNRSSREKAEQYERVSNDIVDLSALEYHYSVCDSYECSICGPGLWHGSGNKVVMQVRL